MKYIFIIFLFTYTSSLLCQEKVSFIAESFGTSAQMLSIGQIKGFGNSASSIFENPASISQIKNFSIAVFQSEIFDEVSYKNAAFALKTNIGNISFGYLESGVDNIPKTTEIINDTFRKFAKTGETYPTKFKVSKIGYAFPLKRKFTAGVSYSYYENNIENINGKGYNLDLGLLFQTKHFNLSSTFQNIIPNQSIEYSNNQNEQLPLNSSLGVQLNSRNTKLLFQARTENSDIFYYSAGIIYSPQAISFIHFSSGVKEIPHLNKKKLNLSAGIALELFGLNLSYAYEKTSHIEYNHFNYFSIGINL